MARRKAPTIPIGAELPPLPPPGSGRITSDPFTPFGIARGHAIAIARDRTGLLSEEGKNAALKYIEGTLELWKLAQADADGTIQIEPLAGLLGPFFPEGITLADMAKPGPKRVPVSRLKPWSCAGPFVRSAADLWVMLWAKGHEEIAKTEKVLPLDLVMALLVERDGDKMPVDSIASALRYLWISTWVSLRASQDESKVLAAIIGRRNELRRKQLADLKLARAITARNKAERARKLSVDLMTMAVDLFKADISLTVEQVATRLRKYEEFAHLSHRGICDRIKGAQTTARRLLARPPS